MRRFGIALGIGCATSAALAQTVPADEIRYGLPVPVAPTDYAAVAGQQAWTLSDFDLPDGSRVTLDLEAVQVLSPSAQLIEMHVDGAAPLADPPVALFRGAIRGQDDTRVFLSVAPAAVYGFVQTADERYLVSTGSPHAGLPTVIFDPDDVPAGWLEQDPFVCGAETLGWEHEAPRGGISLRGEPCRVADIALETDYEFWQIWGNSADASAYAVTLMAAISEIYQADLNMTFEITFLRIWNNAGDPWTQNGGTGSQLYEFQDYWNLNETGVSRHVAHFLSGRGLGGGVAYGDAACYPEYDYGLSANLNGSFPYPLELNSNDNWDLIVVAHELGHNFGNPHTHSIGIDGCGDGDCTGAENGTLMSYCHLCEGGLANMALQFHPTMLANEMLPFVNGPQCDLSASGPAITLDPADEDVCAGAGFTLTAAASGDPSPSYQWYKDGGAIGGATSASYTVASASVADAGSYEVVVSNGCGSAASASATVSICGGSPADVNGDCLVDLSDLAQVLANFGTSGASLSDGDVTGDGNVDLSDLAEVLGAFGEGC